MGYDRLGGCRKDNEQGEDGLPELVCILVAILYDTSDIQSFRKTVSKLTGRCSNAHANGGTHAGGAALSGAVDPIRIPVVATEHPLGQ